MFLWRRTRALPEPAAIRLARLTARTRRGSDASNGRARGAQRIRDDGSASRPRSAAPRRDRFRPSVPNGAAISRYVRGLCRAKISAAAPRQGDAERRKSTFPHSARVATTGRRATERPSNRTKTRKNGVFNSRPPVAEPSDRTSRRSAPHASLLRRRSGNSVCLA